MRKIVLQILGGIGIATVILAIVLGLSWFGLTKITVPPPTGPKGYFAIDWPDGGHSNKDRWRSGTVFGHNADRIRREALPDRVGVDVNSLTFYMSVPMSDFEFEVFLDRLAKTKEYEFRADGSWPHKDFRLPPDWFAPMNGTNFIGFAKDDSSWWVYIFRPPDSKHVFFVVS
ncbi:hypothetical protein VSU19_20845 [Verrucomicrobiales bacterium BCK34]|nr:hypothetical protein [Verrucomicrobiales bacterium BCK34]